jgi:hypothetical protein
LFDEALDTARFWDEFDFPPLQHGNFGA